MVLVLMLGLLVLGVGRFVYKWFSSLVVFSFLQSFIGFFLFAFWKSLVSYYLWVRNLQGILESLFIGNLL